MRRKTTHEFISEAISTHGCRYDYSNTIYINSKLNVKIKCKKCELIFEQRPDHHLTGHGCSNCGGNKKMTQSEFTHKSNILHRNKYDYSSSIYKNVDTHITIICPIHGKFIQTPYHHLNGQGCTKCANNYKCTTNEFISKAINVHGNIYNYTLTDYINNYTKIIINCPSHGDFSQTPKHHLRGQGCPTCKKSKGETIIELWLKSNNIPYMTQKSFESCINIKPLLYDFYIPSHNICIEFDGEQHFIPARYSKNKSKMISNLHNIQYRDKIKTKYCMDNNIQLIRIPYTDINNIHDILHKHLKF